MFEKGKGQKSLKNVWRNLCTSPKRVKNVKLNSFQIISEKIQQKIQINARISQIQED